ncbi:MAG: ATP synthase F1 subunit epsilon [Pseudomonadota bacterium]
MAAELTLEVLTPWRKVVSKTCGEVTVPAVGGEIGILPEHTALVSALSAGALRFRVGDETEVLAVRGGFVHVSSNHVAVLADEAALPSELDKAKIQTECTALEEKILGADASAEGLEKLLGDRDWLEAQRIVAGA